jgi:orotate phosphoribosyltransferase
MVSRPVGDCASTLARWRGISAATGRPYARRVTDAAAAARSELLDQIVRKAVVRGRVTLSSGREADYYVDLRRITLDAVAAPLVGEVMLALVDGIDVDAVGGLTLGADPVAAAMLHAAAGRGRRLDAFVVRKEGKAHGLQRRIEGPDVAGRRVLAVEDTSTTGGSVLTAVGALREAGAEVVAVAVIVDRDTGAREVIEAQGLPYYAAYGVGELGLG